MKDFKFVSAIGQRLGGLRVIGGKDAYDLMVLELSFKLDDDEEPEEKAP